MNIKIIETGEVRSLSIINPLSGLDFTEDFVSSAGGFENKDFVLLRDEGVYSCSRDTFDWWVNIISKHQELNYRIKDLLEERNAADVYEAIADVRTIDIADHADACNAALD